jgi:hypothetical protein
MQRNGFSTSNSGFPRQYHSTILHTNSFISHRCCIISAIKEPLNDVLKHAKINFTETVYNGVKCVKLLQDRFQWWVLVYMVMKFGNSQKKRNILEAERLASSHNWLSPLSLCSFCDTFDLIPLSHGDIGEAPTQLGPIIITSQVTKPASGI